MNAYTTGLTEIRSREYTLIHIKHIFKMIGGYTMKTMYYESLQTGKTTLYVVKYSDIKSKEVRYILYDIGLSYNIYEDINTGKMYAIPDSELF